MSLYKTLRKLLRPRRSIEHFAYTSKRLIKQTMAQDSSKLKLDQLIYGTGTNWREWYEKLPFLCGATFGIAANWVSTGVHTYPEPDTAAKWTARGFTAAEIRKEFLEF